MESTIGPRRTSGFGWNASLRVNHIRRRDRERREFESANVGSSSRVAEHGTRTRSLCARAESKRRRGEATQPDRSSGLVPDGRSGTCDGSSTTSPPSSSFQGPWLPEPYGFPNSGRERKSALPAPRGPCSISQTVGIGTKESSNANFFGGPVPSELLTLLYRFNRGGGDAGPAPTSSDPRCGRGQYQGHRARDQPDSRCPFQPLLPHPSCRAEAGDPRSWQFRHANTARRSSLSRSLGSSRG